MILNKTLMDSIPRTDRRLLIEVSKRLDATSDFVKTLGIMKGPTYRCHSICRALAKMIPKLRVVDGEYAGLRAVRKKRQKFLQFTSATHSWLVTPTGNIIDPYPVGILCFNPILIIGHGTYAPFGRGLYVRRDKAFAHKVMTPEFLRETKILLEFMTRAFTAWDKHKR